MSLGSEIAIKVENLSKTFKIPHEKISTLRGAFVNLFRSKGYEKFNALDDVSFEVKKGEFFGIIGRNGSGKSTLLKILAGIYQPDGGKIKINGLISPFLELGIGFNPELSGRDNIYLNAAVLGLSKKQIDEKFDDIVRFSELRRFVDQKVKNYSSGMQVRLAFSVAIHANRDILLMDEVLAVGDTNFQSKCMQEFNRYKDMGKTVILVTHDIVTVQRYCDRAMLLRSGKIETIGDPEKVVSKYIYQNMSDEEKRMVDEGKQKRIKAEKDLENMKGKEREEEKRRIKKEKIKKEEERKNKVVEITKVEFFDKGQNIKNVFQTGQDLFINVYCRVFKQVKDPIFGIIIYDFKANPIFATNTNFAKLQTGNLGQGPVKVVFKIKNYFSNGTYPITVAISDSHAKIYYDWKDNIAKFNVKNDNYHSGGYVDLPHEIIIEKNNYETRK
jgi:ABC-type polysaccharide/polyol phosphate transport system ATPase subunit